MNFIGQRKLLEKLNKYTRETLPKTLLFLGNEGCGKHTVIKMLANRFSFEVIEIDPAMSDNETLAQAIQEDYSRKTIPTMFIIDIVKFSSKGQNALLKFIEEPGPEVFISIIASSEIGILPTILNRCIKLRFELYLKEELQAITNISITNDLIFEICKTPGMLKCLDTKTFDELYELCVKLVTKIKTASYANTMSLFTRVNYKDEYSKFDFDVFFNTLEYTAFTDFKTTGNEDSFKVYQIVNTFKQHRIRLYREVAKEAFMLNFLTQLWKEFHE